MQVHKKLHTIKWSLFLHKLTEKLIVISGSECQLYLPYHQVTQNFNSGYRESRLDPSQNYPKNNPNIQLHCCKVEEYISPLVVLGGVWLLFKKKHSFFPQLQVFVVSARLIYFLRHIFVRSVNLCIAL